MFPLPTLEQFLLECNKTEKEIIIFANLNKRKTPVVKQSELKAIKDGVYFCYCAYVLRISRYLGFLWVVPPNELSKCFQYPKRKFGVTMHFAEIIKLQFEKNAIHCFLFYSFLGFQPYGP